MSPGVQQPKWGKWQRTHGSDVVVERGHKSHNYHKDSRNDEGSRAQRCQNVDVAAGLLEGSILLNTAVELGLIVSMQRENALCHLEFQKTYPIDKETHTQDNAKNGNSQTVDD